jgi:DNA-binding transcriptional regulator of glucitol operon
MALSVFAAAFEVIVGFSVAHWITVTGSKRWGYSISVIAFCICIIASWMALRVRTRVSGTDQTLPNQGRRLFMANLNLLSAGLVALLVVAGTLVLVSLRPDS